MCAHETLEKAARRPLLTSISEVKPTGHIGTFEAKTYLTRLLDRVASGEQITITRHGTPIARLVPVKPTSSRQIWETIAKLKQFSKGQTLGGLKVKDLIEEGRR